MKQEIECLKNGRKSKTSSTPSSRAAGRSNQKSLRSLPIHITGGQDGNEGSTSEMTDKPVEVIEYRPDYYQGCGEKSGNQTATVVSQKQEIVMPPILSHYADHQSYSCACKKCGHETVSEFPFHSKSNIQYRTSVHAYVGYFSIRRYLSCNRIAEMMRKAFTNPMGEGANILKRLVQKTLPVHELIMKRVQHSAAVGGHETGVKIHGKKGWLFTFQTQAFSLLSTSLSRGFYSIQSLFKKGFSISIYAADCLDEQLKAFAKSHQISTSHLLSKLTNFIEVLHCKCSVQVNQFLQEAIELKSQLTANDYAFGNEQVVVFEKRLSFLLQTNSAVQHKKVRTFIKRLNKSHHGLFTFLNHSKVPHDNNGYERFIRTANMKMKVSGQLRPTKGAQCFAIVRSVADTAVKNSQRPLNAFHCLARLGPEKLQKI